VHRRQASFAWAGVAAGLAFWIKPHAMLYLGLFLSYPIVFRRWNWQWAWMLVAFIAAVLANNVLFWSLSGNPLFLIDAVRSRQNSGYLESGIAAGAIENAPLYYLDYLFGRIYHTWLAGYLALVALVLWMIRRSREPAPTMFTMDYIVWWAVGLLALFSLFVVSWQPLILVPKQTNYMLVFVAPLTLLAGQALAQLGGRSSWVIAALIFLPSVLLAGMEQNSIRVFTSNSKAALDFSRNNASAEVFVNTNALQAATFNNLVHPRKTVDNMHFIGELANARPRDNPQDGIRPRFAIIDTETLSWSATEPFTSVAAVPSCWHPIGELQPAGMGSGTAMLQLLRPLTTLVPGKLGDTLRHRLDGLVRPAPAHLFKIPITGCKLANSPSK